MKTAADTPTQLLGPLNPVERTHAPDRLSVAGDVAILETGARVSIVGARVVPRAAKGCVDALED